MDTLSSTSETGAILFVRDNKQLKLRFSKRELCFQIHRCKINAKAERFLCNEKAQSYYLWLKDELETAYQQLKSLSKRNTRHERIQSIDIKSSIDIVDVVSGYLDLKKSGKNFTGLCPFHTEKHPSFTVYPDTQSWYCFSCQRGGDAIDFIRFYEGIEFKEALELLAGRSL